MDNFWPFCPSLTLRVPENGSKYVVCQKEISQSNSSFKVMYISKIFDGNGQFWPLEALAWEMALRIKQFWKIILRSIKNHWETNLSKIIQKIPARPIYQDVWFLFWIFFTIILKVVCTLVLSTLAAVDNVQPIHLQKRFRKSGQIHR